MHDTYNDIYMRIYKRLSKDFPDNAPDMAREIVCHTFGKPRADFHKIRQLYTIESKTEEIERYIELCMTGRPLPYIFGEWDFYGLNFEITPDVLIPRPETEILAETAISHLKAINPSSVILDLCTGSGCVGIAVASNVKYGSFKLIDSSKEALEIARKNVEKHGLTDRIQCVKGDVFKDPDPAFADFNMIICNPPYVRTGDIKGLDASVRNFEPLAALDGGEDGLRFYRAVVLKWTRVLKNGGQLLFECGYDQAEQVMGILVSAGYTDVGAVLDYAGIQRVVTGRRPTQIRFTESI